MHGIHLLGDSNYCWKAEHFVVWKTLDYGVYVWTDNSVLLTNMILADNKVNIFLNCFRPNPLTHESKDNTVTVQNSLIIGRSSNFHCVNDNFIPFYPSKAPGKRSSRPPDGRKFYLLNNLFTYYVFQLILVLL